LGPVQSGEVLGAYRRPAELDPDLLQGVFVDVPLDVERRYPAVRNGQSRPAGIALVRTEPGPDVLGPANLDVPVAEADRVDVAGVGDHAALTFSAASRISSQFAMVIAARGTRRILAACLQRSIGAALRPFSMFDR